MNKFENEDGKEMEILTKEEIIELVDLLKSEEIAALKASTIIDGIIFFLMGTMLGNPEAYVVNFINIASVFCHYKLSQDKYLPNYEEDSPFYELIYILLRGSFTVSSLMAMVISYINGYGVFSMLVFFLSSRLEEKFLLYQKEINNAIIGYEDALYIIEQQEYDNSDIKQEESYEPKLSLKLTDENLEKITKGLEQIVASTKKERLMEIKGLLEEIISIKENENIKGSELKEKPKTRVKKK